MDESLGTLIVDDDENIRFILKETLERMGHVVTVAGSGEAALDLLQDTAFDLLLLDLVLGGAVDGQKVLQAARWRWPSILIIMLTGHGSLESAVQAIREGVDGYLLKPAKPDDIRQAVREALYRRKKLREAETKPEEESVLRRGGVTVDLQRHIATVDGQPLDVSPGELALLTKLMQRAPEVVPTKDLVAAVRGYSPDYEYEARAIIKWYVHRLRKRIEPDASNPRYILNVRGVGYRFAE